MDYGPVDVVVLAIGEPHFDGSILRELEKLAKAGTIRVLDAMVLIKADEDTVIGMDMEDLPDQEKAALGFIETGTRGLFDSEDSAMLAEGLATGSAIVALAIENTWAIPFVESIFASGAELGFTTRIPAPVVSARLAELAAK